MLLALTLALVGHLSAVAPSAASARAFYQDPARNLAGSVPLQPGDDGTAQTVALIRRAYQAGLTDPLVRSTAGQLVRGLDAQDLEGQARAIFNWVKRNIRFVRDPVGHEVVSSASFTLTHGFGDCDDVNAVLIPSLLGAVGIHTQLVTVATYPDDPSFTHIYCEAQVGGLHGSRGGWVPLDMARPGAAFGVTGNSYFRKRVWDIEGDSYRDLAGLSGGYRSITQAPVRTLGDDGGFDWSGLASIITAGTAAATNVIASLRTPASNLYYRTPALTATGAQATYPGGQASFSSFGAIDPTTLLLMGGGLMVVLLATRR